MIRVKTNYFLVTVMATGRFSSLEGAMD